MTMTIAVSRATLLLALAVGANACSNEDDPEALIKTARVLAQIRNASNYGIRSASA